MNKMLEDKQNWIKENALKEYLSNIGFNVNEDFTPFDDIVCVKEDGENKYTLNLNYNLFDENDKLVDIRDKVTLEKYITFKIRSNSS